MRKSLAVITPLCDRPKGFDLCRVWMRRQTLQPDQWIVVDNSKVPCVPNVSCLKKMGYQHKGFKYVTRQHTEEVSFSDNLREACRHVDTDFFAVVEDDDWRGERYLEDLYNEIDVEGAKISCSWQYPVYHISSGYCVDRVRGDAFRNRTVRHFNSRGKRSNLMNLHIMAYSDPCIGYLMGSCERSHQRRRLSQTAKATSVMKDFWEEVRHREIPHRLLYNTGQIVAIKGIPGKRVSGVHSVPGKIAPHYMIDEDRSILKRWVGEEDARLLLSTLE
jgi:hypothetical protein